MKTIERMKRALCLSLSCLVIAACETPADFEDESAGEWTEEGIGTWEEVVPRELLFDNIPMKEPLRTLEDSAQETESDKQLKSGFLPSFTCGPHLLTYRVVSNAGASGLGVRCVKMISADGKPATFGPTFAFYGEGRWGNFVYRNVGEAYGFNGNLTLRAADIYGNGENGNGRLTGGEISLTTSGGAAPSTITLSGAWNETWQLASHISGYVPLASVKTCGPHFDKYRAESISDPEAGFGVRCRLKGTNTWYGEGRWGSRRYAHLGYAFQYYSFMDHRVVSSFGASDLCKPGHSCGTFNFGSLKLNPKSFPHVGNGFELIGWNERWLPYSRRYAVRLDAVRVANDNGITRRTRVTPNQVSQWVDYANRVYAGADVEFLFIEDWNGPDFRDLSNSLINSMTGGGAAWESQKNQANMNSRQGRLTFFFRWGNAIQAGGGGFSGGDLNFVAMPGFNDTWLCGANRNIGVLAHESGHYFGLAHPFPAKYHPEVDNWLVLDTVAEAEQFFIDGGRKKSVFDADGLSDTLYDPYISALACTDDLTVVLDGTVFSLPRSNIMGYWPLPSWAQYAHSMSADQISITHKFITSRGLD